MSEADRDAPRGPLAGQVALVTGASRGIGRALSVGLATAGAAVGLLARDADALEAVQRDIAAAGGRAVAAPADVTVVADVRRAVGVVEDALGAVDLLVNNAGRIEQVEAPVWETDPEEWWAVVETNLRGPLLLIGAVVPGMVARGGGRVIDVSSGFGGRDTDVYSGYAASKAALFRLGGAVASAGAEHGVRAFEVAPGLVRTELSEAMARHAALPEDAWTPVEAVVRLVVAVARGQLDELSGRYLRADRDDVASLRAAARRVAAADARVLRIRAWGDDDPLLGGHPMQR